MTAAQDAMRRAARHLPQMQLLTLYTRATDPKHGRPMATTFTETEVCHGSVRWRDVDEVSQLGGGDVGDGVVSLVAPSAPGAPDLIRTASGEFLLVKGGAGRDSLGLSVKVAVARWTGDAPVILPAP